MSDKCDLWNNPPIPVFTLAEFTSYNGAVFKCKTTKGAIVLIDDIIAYQLYAFGIAYDKNGCQSEIVKN